MEGQLKLIIKRWGMLPFAAAGVALLALLLLVVVALPSTRVPYPSPPEPPDKVPLHALPVPGLPFEVDYPTTWHYGVIEGGVVLWPTLRGVNNFAERGAALYIYTAADESGAGCPVSDTFCAELDNHTLREAQNVLVGGMSGSETASELSVANSTTTLLGRAMKEALTDAQTQYVTLIAWQATQEGTHYHVLMIDARDGAYMDLLQEIRGSIEWDPEAVE